MPVEEVVGEGGDVLVMRVTIPQNSPHKLFQYWINPELLCGWWPQEAEIEGRKGGGYHLSWPQMNWHLRGSYTEFVPPGELAFTWQWDTDRDSSPYLVSVLFEDLDGSGAVVTVRHSGYEGRADADEVRESHRQGWEHFLGRLEEVVTR